jgi:hypothetical protein
MLSKLTISNICLYMYIYVILYIAIKIFQELRNERYVAATHFELGSLHYWGSCIGEKNADGRNFSSTHIEQAISHYKYVIVYIYIYLYIHI